MSGWEDLRWLGLVVRPFDGPPPPAAWERSRFDAPLASTVRLLARELTMLDANQVVLEVDVREGDLRLDGFPRAHVRLSHPGVRLSFGSKWGPLRYETGEYDDWRDNLRAVALSMEALRAVDRYGVSKRGEQYRGWRQLTTGTDPADSIQTREQAEALLSSYGGVVDALKATHPDHGGDPSEFRKVMRAKELVGR